MSEPVRPIPAATVLLLRDGPAGIEVLMLEKAAGKHFAGGALVFPGGKIEAQDEAFGGCIGEARHPLSVHKIAAVREMFEECGIMLVRRPGSDRLLDREEVMACCASAPSTQFLDMAVKASLELATDRMVHFAHWITPPLRSARFDAHFFIAAVPEGQMTATVDGYEIVDANWRRPADVLEDMSAGTVKLVLPTMMNLDKLSNRANVETALAVARADKVVCVVPDWIESDSGTQITIPAEAGYGVTTIPAHLVRKA